MQYRIDKKSGNKLSSLGLGCMRFPKRRSSIDMEKAEEIILTAIEHGINYFDTAYIYPGSEEALGAILEKHNLRDKVFIADKLPLFVIKSRQDFDKYFNRQLLRLKTDYIDYFLMHMLTDIHMWERLCSWGIREWIDEKKRAGQIKQIGFSFHGSYDQFASILNSYDWEFCLIQYNYSNENYQAGVSGLKIAYEKGIPVMIMEPLLGGRLVYGLPAEARNIFKKANADLSPAAWGLKWLWNQDEVTVILSGMSSKEQLLDNINASENALPGSMTDHELETVKNAKAAFNASYKIKCTGCNYCMPCHKNVNIPGCFASYNTSFASGKKTGMRQYMQSTGTFSKLSGAGLCVRCGKCEKHCPQNIKIMDSLADVKKRMEPFWYRAILKIGRIVLKKG